jgi:hypothetical protein
MSRKKVAVVVLPLVPVIITRIGGNFLPKAFKKWGCHLKANLPGKLVAEPLPLKRIAKLRALTKTLAKASLSVHEDVGCWDFFSGIITLFYTESV